jgi:hypothetical protein
MPKTFAQKVIQFNQNLHFTGKLPTGFRVLNPFLDNPETVTIMKEFYQKYYNDIHPRKLILGINPSRHGAGVTGVPFTDTKRLESVCGITMHSARTHEISSVYVYAVIAAYGGPEAFYSRFYINSPFPLAIIRQNPSGGWVNANYYDDKALFASVKDFMIDRIREHISLGLYTEEVFILGRKNAAFLQKLNAEARLFGKLTPLDHPRYIQQYKSKTRDIYIANYLEAFTGL